DESGEFHLYVRFFDILQPRRLSGTDGASLPFWSPDSRFVAFFAEGKLKKVDINGAPPLTIATAGNGRPGSWSEDDVILFSPSTNDPIHSVPDTGGEAVAVTKIDRERGETTHRWAHFLPDGRHFIYMAASHNVDVEDEVNAIWVGSLDDPDFRKLVAHARSNAAYANGHVLYERDQILVAQPFDPEKLEILGDSIPIAEGVAYAPDFFGGSFSVSPSGVLVYGTGSTDWLLQLTWFDRDGNELGAVGSKARSEAPVLSPDDRRAAVTIDDATSGSSDIWLIDLERDVRTRFTFEDNREQAPRWSPDGSMIAYQAREISAGNAVSVMKVKSTTGSADPEEVYAAPEGAASPRAWGPDGTEILFMDDRSGSRDIKALDLDGSREPRSVLAQDHAEVAALLSPDGKWLLYVTDESGEFHSYVTSWPDLRGKWQISRDGSRCCGTAWRGNEIFFKGTQGRIMVARVEEDNGSLIVSNPEPLFINSRIDSFDVTHDGQRILANVAPEVEETGALTIITNWTAMIEDD
ncbi:MAG: hypothetical protein R3338_15460, partial [Thermoanaerobaculia bacterium]|nr:hypothetical protein [Thermoanaerobaculia bacterium]